MTTQANKTTPTGKHLTLMVCRFSHPVWGFIYPRHESAGQLPGKNRHIAAFSIMLPRLVNELVSLPSAPPEPFELNRSTGVFNKQPEVPDSSKPKK